MRARILGVVTLLLLAPITAELLQAYLGDLGGAGGVVFVVLFFTPFYGGVALLIREVSVRTRRGWTGRLLLAAAFGVAMPTIIDVSLFTTVNGDIDDWRSIVTAASIGGIGASAALTWIGGHVLMSVSTPIVVAETLAGRSQPWLGRVGLAITTVAFLAVAVALHQDHVTSYHPDAGPWEYAASAAVVVLLIGLALSPLGRPMPPRAGRTPAPWQCLGMGAVAMAGFDVAPYSWAGVALAAGVLVVAG